MSYRNMNKKDVLTWLEKQGKNNMGISEATKQELKDNLNKALEKETPESYNEFLENQGEQKYVPKFKVGDTIAKKHNSDINDFGSFTITDITGGKYWYNDRIICDITEQDEWELYEPVRQKPAWSEEDEIFLNLSLENLTELKDRFGKYYGKVGGCIDWLKSLRPQNRWKPSNEQLCALEHATMYNTLNVNDAANLATLYNDLKKLREE